MESVITQGVPCARVHKMKERLLAAPCETDIERARFMMGIFNPMFYPGAVKSMIEAIG